MNRLAKVVGGMHQRSVWQVLGSYAVGSWIILQLAETLAGLIGLPLWFGPTIVALVVMGFPVLLVTTLVQGSGRAGEEASAQADTVGEGSGEDVAGADVFRGLRRVFTWRNVAAVAASATVLLMMGTAGYSGMRMAGIGPVGSLMARGVIDDQERLVLAHFDDRTPGGLLGETVTALLRIDLMQSPAIVLLEQVQLQPALRRMRHDPALPMDADVALDLAQREGVKAVVVGEVLPLGEGAVVVARLIRAGSGETMVALSETAWEVEDIPDAVDLLSAQLRERIGESLRSIQGNPPLQQVTTPSLQALRTYAQAEHATDAGDLERARALLREAVTEDSTFSMAWRKLGILLQNANVDLDQATGALQRAFDGRERLTERERYLADAAYYTYVTPDASAAKREYERLLEAYPTDRIALNNLAIAYSTQGRQEDAVQLYLRSIRQGGAPAVTYTNAIRELFVLGHADSAAAILEEFHTVYPDNPFGLTFAAAFASARFDYAEAESNLRRLLEAESEPMFRVMAWSGMTNMSVVRGRASDGAEYHLQALDLQDETGVRVFPQPRAINEGVAFALIALVLSENVQDALFELDRGLAALPLEGEAPENLGHVEYARLYAMAGEVDRARERLRAYEAEVPEGVRSEPQRRSELLTAEAAIAGAEGRSQEALRLLLEARELVTDCSLCLLADLGEAYERTAQPDSAVAVLRRYLETPDFFRFTTDSFALHRVLLALGRSYEALGQPAEAAPHYRRFVELWSDADADLQPRVDRVRARLAELEGGS
jgi:tetratricopeptide (TPR) repeat protein